MRKQKFSEILIDWYREHKRDLPWRNTTDPYKIWLSEIILQQTRVAQGLPYYNKFIEKYPRLADLALAPEDEALSLWQGLGYYSRARNMHICSKTLQSEYGGRFPRTYRELRKLKGIGPYTAAAIASFSFKERVAVVDGNVYRTLSRYFGVKDDIASAAGRKKFQDLANELIPADQPDVYNQAAMEFGALQCRVKDPDCDACPLAPTCYARKRDAQHKLPVKGRRLKKKDRYFHYFAIACDGRILMKKRPAGDIWTGLYDFLLIEDAEKNAFDRWRAETEDLDLQLQKATPFHKRALTHQNIYACFYVLEASQPAFKAAADQYQLTPFGLAQAANLPKPVLIANFLNEEIF